MSDELLKFYNRELAFLRKMGAEFAEAHPGVAGNLGIGAEGENDPFVGRMIEGIAYLNARTRFKIEDDFPEISGSMLDILYPHYQKPIPSSSIVQFTLDPGQADCTEGQILPRHSRIQTEPVDGSPCQYRTCNQVTVWPLNITDTRLEGQPLSAPQTKFSAKAASAIGIKLESFSKDIPLADLTLDQLRFFIRAQSPFNFNLYELLMNHVIGTVITEGNGNNDRLVELPVNSIAPVGFHPDEGLFDYTAQSFLGYRLLTEFFAFPQKFLFFDLILQDAMKRITGTHAEIYLYLDQHIPELELQVSADTLVLGCTPMVNLYSHRAEPLRLTHFESEYPLIPDARSPMAHEVYTIDRVVGTARGERSVEYRPFYSVHHHDGLSRQQNFWHANRRQKAHDGEVGDQGTDMWLSFVDLEYRPLESNDWTIDIETTCLSRDLPNRLPFGGDKPRLQYEGEGVVTVRCLTPPTKTLRPKLHHGSRWRLLSHLSLNHLSLANSTDGPIAIKEILRLYDFQDSSETMKMINGISDLRVKRVASRVAGPTTSTICRGLEVTLELDEEAFTSGGLFLFSSVLEHFFGLYASINSFTQTVLVTKQRSEEIRRWPPRAGQQVIL